MALQDGATGRRLTDPFEVAYLRGGAEEVARTGLVDLIMRGALEVERTRKPAGVTLAPVRAAGRNLPPLQAALFALFPGPMDGATIFEDRTLVEAVLPHCGGYRDQLVGEGWLRADAEAREPDFWWLVCALPISATVAGLLLESLPLFWAGMIGTPICGLLGALLEARGRMTDAGRAALRRAADAMGHAASPVSAVAVHGPAALPEDLNMLAGQFPGGPTGGGGFQHGMIEVARGVICVLGSSGEEGG